MNKEKRWKPKERESYYFIRINYLQIEVLETKWERVSWDKIHYKNHNCFRTKAQASKKLREIKAILRG